MSARGDYAALREALNLIAIEGSTTARHAAIILQAEAAITALIERLIEAEEALATERELVRGILAHRPAGLTIDEAQVLDAYAYAVEHSSEIREMSEPEIIELIREQGLARARPHLDKT